MEAIKRRVITVNGQKIVYKYNTKTREVTSKYFPSFIAGCWDWAPEEVKLQMEGKYIPIFQ